MFSPKYGLNGPIKRILSTVEVRQITSSYLVTIVSRVLQPQDGKIPCPWAEIFKIFLTSHDDLFIFGQCLDNYK